MKQNKTNKTCKLALNKFTLTLTLTSFQTRGWNTNYFTFEEDPEPFGQVRDRNIVAMCKELGITVVQEASHTLYSLNK